MERAEPHSPRLHYEALTRRGLDDLYRLAVDPHIRRYLLDGLTVSRDWCDSELARSERSFEQYGVGLWLIAEEGRAESPPETGPVGFAGFRVFEEISPELQLLYAFLEGVTGQGYATECARALLEAAGRIPGAGIHTMLAGVDAPNRASLRVVEKLGFRPAGSVPGEFGEVLLFRWRRVEAGVGIEPT